MNRKLKNTFLLLLVLVLFIGCEDFFTFNLFKGLDIVILPSAEDLEGMSNDEALDYLDENLASNSFVEELADDSESFNAINDYLVNAYEDPYNEYSDAQEQEAAIMAADLQLGVSGGSEVINNILGAVGELETIVNGSGSSYSDVATVLEIIIPEGVDTAEEMQALINGFLEADAAYTALGTSLGGGAAITVEGGVVMNAVVTAMVSVMVDTFTTDSIYAGEVFMAVMNGDDPSSVDPGGQPGTMTTDVFADTYVDGIATAAGIDLSNLFSSGSGS